MLTNLLLTCPQGGNLQAGSLEPGGARADLLRGAGVAGIAAASGAGDRRAMVRSGTGAADEYAAWMPPLRAQCATGGARRLNAASCKGARPVRDVEFTWTECGWRAQMQETATI